MALRDYLVNLVIGKLEEQGLRREPQFFDQFSDDELEQAHIALCDEAETESDNPRENGVGQSDLDEIIAAATAGRRAGFTQLPNWLIESADLSDGALRLYLYMLSWKGRTNLFSRSQDTMATAMGCSDRTIRRRLTELESADLITPVYLNTNPEVEQSNRYIVREVVIKRTRT